MTLNPTGRAAMLFNRIPQAPFKVINPNNKRVIAIVKGKEILIMDKAREISMLTWGINIPPFLREKFENKSVIYRDDPLYYQAFITAECWNLLRSGYTIENEDPSVTKHSFEDQNPSLPTIV